MAGEDTPSPAARPSASGRGSAPVRRVRLPAGTVVPPRGKITLPFRAAADGGEVGIFDVATQLPLEAAFLAALRGRACARIPDGAESWGSR